MGRRLSNFCISYELRVSCSKYTTLRAAGWLSQLRSDLGSGRDLAVHGFEPRVGLCVDTWEPGAYFRFCVPLSAAPRLVLSLPPSLKNT